jgi:hypothetical protein
MPDLRGRKRYEQRIQEAMQEVFAEALKVVDQGLDAVNRAIKAALQKYVGPIIEEVHRRVIIALLILFGDDDLGRSVLGDASKKKGPIYDDLIEQAKRRASKQVDDLGEQMSDTNSSWWDEWDEEEPIEDWASERLFPDSRAGNVAITETTNAVTIGEATVVETMRELGVGVTARWYTKRDERVCPVCGPLHETGPANWADDFAMGPPAHPRCRCYLLYFLGEQ